MTSVRNAAAAVLAVGLSSGCQSTGMGCEDATVEALEAKRVGQEVVMTAKVTHDGEPVDGIVAGMSVRIRVPGAEDSGNSVASATTDANGIAEGRVPLERWNHELRLHETEPLWYATISPEKKVDGVLYCWTQSEWIEFDPKLLPKPYDKQPDRGSTPAARASAGPGSVISPEVQKEIESTEPLTIPEPGEDPGFDD